MTKNMSIQPNKSFFLELHNSCKSQHYGKALLIKKSEFHIKTRYGILFVNIFRAHYFIYNFPMKLYSNNIFVIEF